MKKLILSILICFNSYAAETFSIQISAEVLRAMDLSPRLAARLAGGDIIGNGGGLVEQEFRYAYRRLSKIISSCSASALCPFAGRELEVLKKIGVVSHKYIAKKDRLIFLSSVDYPGFFEDTEDAQVRVAKTAFIEGAPIFINLDMIYAGNGAAFDFPTMISILVHEIGHQIGIKSHSTLDDMGAKLRDYITQDKHTSTFRHEKGVAVVQVYNLKKVDHFAEVFFSYNGDITPLTSKIRSRLKCDRENSTLIGFEISNAHWERLRGDRGIFVLEYKSWIKIHCLDLSTSAIWDEDRDLSMDIHLYDGSYLSLELNIN